MPNVSHGLNQYYRPGEWNCFCQRCGRKRKSDDVAKQWDGLIVCKEHLDERQPQDFVRGVVDHQAVPFAVPENPDTFLLTAEITGLTTVAFPAGPENIWDNTSTVHVQLAGGYLATVTELEVLNGANLCAIQNSSGAWEVLQFTVASLTAPSTYALSRLLRGRYGTELAMSAGIKAPFVFIGQSNISTPTWLSVYLGVGDQFKSPVYVTASRNGSDVVIQWIRRSRIPRLDVDDWQDDYFNASLDSQDERYEVDILGVTGNVLRTLRVVAATRVTYSQAEQLADWGSPQTSLTVRVYQTDAILGRGPNYREALLTVI